MKIRIQKYARVSNGANALKTALNEMYPDVQTLHLNHSSPTTFVPVEGDLVISWGSPTVKFDKKYYLSDPDLVPLCANKVKTFQVLGEAGVRIPRWGTTYDDTLALGTKVYFRTTANGARGIGITIVNWGMRVHPTHELWTVDTEADDEYRVHVFDGKVIHSNMKVPIDPTLPISGEIRHRQHGWRYRSFGISSDEVLPDDVVKQSIDAVSSIGCTFGAVDIGYKVSTGEAFVYEVNSAPALTPATAKRYAKAIGDKLGMVAGVEPVSIAQVQSTGLRGLAVNDLVQMGEALDVAAITPGAYV